MVFFEPEVNSKLNFLDLTLERKQYSISPSIYRKPTTTDGYDDDAG
jgi:hypothetical protein